MVAAAVMGAATIAGGVMSSSAAKSAANKQSDAANYATDIGNQQYEQSREDMAPWRLTGGAALNRLADLTGTSGNTGAAGYGSLTTPFSMANYQADPGYQFRLNQGTDALQKSAAARGGLLSGGTLKDLDAYSQGLASQEYQNAYTRYTNNQDQIYNRLAGLAGTGQTASNALAQLGAANATNAGNNAIGAGNAAAAGAVGGANAWSNAIGQGVSAYQNNQLMKMMQGSGSSVPQSAIDAANASSDPIASLNASQGWTGSSW